MPASRTIFFISTSTAITAETLGQSLLGHFEHVDFDQVTIPFIDSLEKASEAAVQINADARMKTMPPIVFSTIIHPEIRQVILNSEGVVFDLFDAFMSRLENELHMHSSSDTGRLHGLLEDRMYNIRIEAVNYALSNDDGISTKDYDRADVIIVGVSRTGKTPTCLYLGLQFGIYAANYPLTEEDLYIEYKKIPGVLQPGHQREVRLAVDVEGAVVDFHRLDGRETNLACPQQQTARRQRNQSAYCAAQQFRNRNPRDERPRVPNIRAPWESPGRAELLLGPGIRAAQQRRPTTQKVFAKMTGFPQRCDGIVHIVGNV